jgi:hypothetical protein
MKFLFFVGKNSYCPSNIYTINSQFGGPSMKQLILSLVLACLMTTTLYAGQSIITEGEGYACMGDDKSRKTTETTAVADAKRKATESASTYLQSETHIKDAMLEKDLLSAYANAQVKVLQELMKEWYKEQSLGDCFRVKLKVEVIPDEKAMSAYVKKNSDTLESDPSGPLSVKVWTDKKEYVKGERMRVYLKANKPFYAQVVYKQADNSLLQLLPNPFRDQNYFNGGVVYEIPSGGDRFDLEVAAPFGSENVTIYASTAPMGKLDLTPAGGVFSISGKASEIPVSTRGVKLVQKGAQQSAAEFAEATAEAVTKASK